MFFVDKPFVSDFFKSTVRDHAIPVVGTAIARDLELWPGTTIIPERQALQHLRSAGGQGLYTTSENALPWITEHLPSSQLAAQIELFKDKSKFRQLTSALVPDFYFRSVAAADLALLPFQDLPVPVVVKPATGFMSAGVHKVRNAAEWERTVQAVLEASERVGDLYPRQVVDPSSYIIESCIKGDEYAVDAYFNRDGEGIILSILEHSFSSLDDVSDRVYTTSAEIIENNLTPFQGLISAIGNLAGLRNFPAHIELRRTLDGTLIPIEVNPLRFGGWCTTADLTYHAYGFNPYLYYYRQQAPDWPTVLKDKAGSLYSIIILDNSTGEPVERIQSFNYQQLLAGFEKPLELRKFNFQEYPIFGFLFTETSQKNRDELQRILVSDLREFITLD